MVQFLLCCDKITFITFSNKYVTHDKPSFFHSATGREVFDWILDQGYYSERDTSNVVRQVLEAVAYLHSLHIVHRNLKVTCCCSAEFRGKVPNCDGIFGVSIVSATRAVHQGQ